MLNRNKTFRIYTQLTSEPFLLSRFQSQTIWHQVILLILPFFLYIGSTGFAFITLKDVDLITDNINLLKNFKNIGLAFTTDIYLHAHGPYYRPLQTISFMLDAMIGKDNAWIYHLSNLVYHLLTVVSLYHLLRLFNIKNISALFAALLFSVHPLLTATVTWMPARADLLLTLFTVWVFITFVQYLRTGRKIYLVFHFIGFLASLFCKETAVATPLLLVLYAYLQGRHSNYFNSKSWLTFGLLWLLPLAIFFLLRQKVIAVDHPDYVVGIAPFVQNLQALPSYIFKAFLPVQLSTMPLYDSLITFLGSLVLFVVLIFIIRGIIKKKPMIVFSLVWFVIFFLPALFIKFTDRFADADYYEHRSYLPMIGLVIFLAMLLDGLRKRSWVLCLALPSLFIITFAFMASAHSDDYRDSFHFYNKAMNAGNPAAASKRGELYMMVRDYTNAANDFNKAIEISEGSYAPAFYNMALLQSSGAKNHAEAEKDLTMAIQLDPAYTEAYIERAKERIFSSNFGGALLDLMKAEKLDSNNVNVYYTRAKVLTNAQKFQEALPWYNKSISMDSSVVEMYNDRAYVEYRLQQFSQALQDCNRATKMNPEFMNAYYNKAMVYLELKKPDVAVRTLDTTLALTSNFYFGYFYRGMAKKELHDMKGACDDWHESVKLGFAMAQDTIKKYCQ